MYLLFIGNIVELYVTASGLADDLDSDEILRALVSGKIDATCTSGAE